MSWDLGRGKRRSIKGALYGEAASGAWSHGGPWRTVRVLPESYLNWGARRLWLLSTDSSFIIGWGCLWGNQLPRTFNLPPPQTPRGLLKPEEKKSPSRQSQMPQYRCPSLLEYRWMQRGCGQVGPWEPLLLYFSTQRDHPSTNSCFSGQSASDVIKDKNTQVPLLKKEKHLKL